MSEYKRYAILIKNHYIGDRYDLPYTEWQFAIKNGLFVSFETLKDLLEAQTAIRKTRDEYKLIEVFQARHAKEIIASAILEVKKNNEADKQQKEK